MEVIKEKLSPMMQQYYAIKEQHPDCIVFYRLGDFYEMFFDDAIVASEILELTLTGRDCGQAERAPMCGIPYHASEGYIAKLIAAGKKVAIVEQLSDPNNKNKASDIVERGIIRIVTPGTVVEEDCLNDEKNNYIVSLSLTKGVYGVCWADVSTGFIEVGEFSGANSITQIDNILSTLGAKEVLASDEAAKIQNNLISVKGGIVPNFTILPDSYFNLNHATKLIKDQFNVVSLKSFDLEEKKAATSAVGALVEYLSYTYRQSLSNLKDLRVYYDKDFLQLDYSARRNLELVENNVTKTKRGSLLGLIDLTKTNMGARKIRSFIDYPLTSSKKINARLDAVSEFFSDISLREDLNDSLEGITDIERIASKIATKTITPKDCFSLGSTLAKIPNLKNVLAKTNSSLLGELRNKLNPLVEIKNMLLSAFNVEAPVNFKDGGFILSGFNDELDKIRNVAKLGYDWVSNFEKTEKERTGIKNLKISYNKVFGYYIEVTKSQLKLVPPEYQLRQTTLGAEKYVTPELKEAERMILTGSHDALELELKLYEEIKTRLYSVINEIIKTADAIANIDAILSLAKVSVKHNYVRPEINEKIKNIEIIGGRHPVVETMMASNEFVDNDTLLDNDENNILIITGPNMGGKSTYMRQVALIVIMAHMGCFVPAKSAKISLTDKIFTRIGASDELAFGNSTFMVEMSEVANIIKNATDKSLLILDEVGRGTSTFDGMSIAYAIIEYIAGHIKAKTFFATHYHELVELEGKIVGVKNYRMLVKELKDSVVFLHKIARGSANRSFGIEVASLAGLPDELVNRAKVILSATENSSSVNIETQIDGVTKPAVDPYATEVINVLREMDMNTISPLMAFGTLQNLVDKVQKK